MTVEIVWAPDSLLTDDAVAGWISKRGASEIVRHNFLADKNLVDALSGASLFTEDRAAVVACPPKMDAASVDTLVGALEGIEMPVMVTMVSDTAPASTLKKLGEVGRVHKLALPKRWDMPKWTAKRARDAGLNIDSSGATALVELLGTDLRSLNNAIAQLKLRFGDKPVKSAEVRRQFDHSAEPPIWDLFDAMLASDHAKAQRVLGRLLGAGEDAMAILFAVASSVRGLIRTKAVLDLNPTAGDSEIAKAVSCSPGRAKVLKRQAAGADVDWLLKVLDSCAEADYQMKGGATDGPDAGRVSPPEQLLTLIAGM